jgi:hypothetical protein
MAYDEDLAQRVREQLTAERSLTEKAIFVGLVFLLDGNISVGLSGGELIEGPGGEGEVARQIIRSCVSSRTGLPDRPPSSAGLLPLARGTSWMRACDPRWASTARAGTSDFARTSARPGVARG